MKPLYKQEMYTLKVNSIQFQTKAGGTSTRRYNAKLQMKWYLNTISFAVLLFSETVAESRPLQAFSYYRDPAACPPQSPP